MKKNYKESELLSAYIDGELSENEIRELEQKIKLSKKLQEKVEDLKQLKNLTSSSIKRIPESPYFETKLMAELAGSKKTSFNYKGWAPVIAFSLLTISIMLLLKFNPNLIDKFVEKQKTSIAGFYTENLKPLLFAADINNEDIFNFAFYNRLPLDKSNQQYLHLGYETNGKEYFEIKKVGNVEPVNNLSQFASALKLNEKQKLEMDSILETYADDLQTQVLVNEKNTVAINPNIWNYNKAILADLLSFAETANKKEFAKILPANYSYDRPSVNRIVRTVKDAKDDEYIFFTPDTIFYESYTFDKDKFQKEMKEMSKQVQGQLKNVQKELKNIQVEIRIDSNLTKLNKNGKWNNFNIWIDSNTCKVNFSNINIPKFDFPDFDSLGEHLEEAAKHLKSFSFNFPKDDEIKKNFKFKIDIGDSTNSYDWNFKIPNMDSLVKFEKFFSDSLKKYNRKYKKNSGKNFYLNLDSLTNSFKFFVDDSLIILDQNRFEDQMENMQQQMEKFREEIEKLRENMQDSIPVPQKAKKKSIEI